MLDRVLPMQPRRILPCETPSRRDVTAARALADAFRDYLRRLLRLLNRLIEAGGPMS